MAKFGVFEGYGGPAQLRRYSSAACHIDVVLPHSGCCRVDDLLGICLAAVQLRRLPASEGPTPCAQLVLSGVMKQSSGKRHIYIQPHRDLSKSAAVAIGWMFIMYETPRALKMMCA